eukprot:CAMPEP_0170135540 /NCGR_PEP_ID=MMETSP0033_2-20121228/2529_1 /TAXON_ID=195969 /ORGANISM="Dolichomastix tenuilepis, Strain CCMP3274" /LENGTH=608 /DNA_ID=CAMNT_0010371141 /DNA_START=25 /DNA_END=1851 /DNA_ORIENTATION=+
MAETVNHMMERMLDELEDLEKRNLFSHAEVKQIVAKRREWEYRMKRRGVELETFLGSIEYDMKLEKLRKHRQKALSYDHDRGAQGKADHCITQRIHFTFERALKRYPQDLSLWRRYFEFCKASKSNKVLSRVLARSLRRHPTEASLWAYAASWEFEDNNNPTTARTLMQRGLRMCKESVLLWQEYLRFELLYAQRLRERRALLGLDTAGPGEEEVEEGEAAALKLVLQNAVAGVVLRKALQALPKSLEFRFEVLRVLEGFEETEALAAQVDESLETEFGAEPRAWDARARRNCVSSSGSEPGEGAAAQVQAACKIYEEGCAAVPTSAMFELHIAFLNERRAKLPELAERQVLVHAAAAEAGVVSESLAVDRVELLRSLRRAAEARAAAAAAASALPDRARVWLLHAETQASNARKAEVTVQALRSTAFPAEDSAPLWARAVELCGRGVVPLDVLTALLDEQLVLRGEHLGLAAGALVELSARTRGIGAARKLYAKWLAMPAPSVHLFRLCVELERAAAAAAGDSGNGDSSSSSPPSATAANPRVRRLLEAACDAHGKAHPQLWLELLALDRSEGRGEANVTWRAAKAGVRIDLLLVQQQTQGTIAEEV